MTKSFQWQVIPICLAGIILILLLLHELDLDLDLDLDLIKTPFSESVVHIEYILSFIASYILFFWMLSPMFSMFKKQKGVVIHLHGVLIYIVYTILLLLTSPFALLSIRFFLQDKIYIKIISILTILSTLFSMYFTLSIK